MKSEIENWSPRDTTSLRTAVKIIFWFLMFVAIIGSYKSCAPEENKPGYELEIVVENNN